jgi:polysaccharide biosynthesis transport protein
MQIRHYLMLARKWMWLALLGLFLGAMGGIILSRIQKPVYQAKTKILVSRNSQTNTDFAYLSDQQLVQTYVELLKTQPILESASEKLGYSVDIKKVTVTQVLTTQVIEIDVENNDPQRAMNTANELVKALIQQSEELQTANYASTEDKLNLQIEQVKKQMDTLRAEYDQSSQADVKTRIAEIDLELTKFEQEITSLQKDITQLDLPKKTEAQSIELNQKKARLAQVEPQLLFYQQIRSNLALLGKPVAAGTVNENPNLVQMQSTLTLYEQLYLSLLNNLESVRLLRVQFTPNIAQIESAALPVKPTSFTPVILIAMFAIIGAVLTSGIAVLIEFMDDSIKSPGDVEYALGLSTLGCIPDVPHSKEETNFFVDQPNSPAADAIRILRKNILHTETLKPFKTLLVVSPGNGEGKTNLVVNLAASFVYLGNRVTVVDANVRSPQLHKLLHLENTIGLGDILSTDSAITKAMTPLEEYKSVSAITAGNIPVSLTEKLESDRLTYILSKLNEKADLVILDGPELFSADSLAFASHVDGVLLVLRPGHTKIDAARDAVDYLKRVGVKVIGVALNRVPQNWEKYYMGFNVWYETKKNNRRNQR